MNAGKKFVWGIICIITAHHFFWLITRKDNHHAFSLHCNECLRLLDLSHSTMIEIVSNLHKVYISLNRIIISCCNIVVSTETKKLSFIFYKKIKKNKYKYKLYITKLEPVKPTSFNTSKDQMWISHMMQYTGGNRQIWEMHRIQSFRFFFTLKMERHC